MENLTLNLDFCSKIEDYAIARGYMPNTIRVYISYLKRIIEKYKILNKDVLRNLLKKIKHRNERAVLVLINDYCYYSDIDFSIVIPKMKFRPRSLPKIVSIEEIKIMVESAPKPYDIMIRCIFNIGAGLRISEAIKLSWSNINWIDWMKKKSYGIAMIKDSKGNKDRMTMIPRKLMEDLYKYAKELNILNEFMIPTGGRIFNCNLNKLDFEPDLFTTDRIKWKEKAVRHAYNWFRHNILKKYCEKALGHKINIHQLRHRRATYLYEVEGIPIERIQELLGHSDIRTTLIYTKIAIKDTFEMMKETREV